MARAETRTLLPLDRFAGMIGMNPLHFNQIASGTCGNPMFQTGWQGAGGREEVNVGREDVAVAIMHAEQLVTAYSGYPPLADWIEAEVSALPPLPWYRGWNGWVRRQLALGHFITGGVEAKTLIQAGKAVVYTDEDGDGYEETATMAAIATTVDVEEIALYYPGEGGADEWEIRPIKVVDNGATVTITCRREQLVKPEKMSVLEPEELEGTDDANFLGTVDIYRHWTDPQTQVQFQWPCPACVTSGESGCVTCGFETQTGCIRAVNPELGIVTLSPGTWNADDSVFDSACWQVAWRPEQAKLWYQAGFRDFRQPRANHDMSPRLAQAISVLAMSLMEVPPCVCMTAAWAHWHDDLARQETHETGGLSYRVGKKVLENPFGTTKGAQRAYELLRTEGLGESANMMMR